MAKQNRRHFIAATSMLGLALSASASALGAKQKKQVIHHVFFWLKNSDSKDDLNKLLEGLQTLKKIETIRQIHIGVPASTEVRPVIDSSYHASELMFFDDVAGQKVYQDHPIHQKFVENYSHLWSKVIVYDSIDV